MSEVKLTKEEFVLQAIRNLRKPPYKGIHVKISDFNSAFRKAYDEESRATVDRMAEEGKIVKIMVRKGPMIYLPDDAPPQEDVLKKILGEG